MTASTDRPVKVIAGAGTGKTETLTRRFVWLVQERGFDPARILAVTFTEKAASEMKARIRAALTKAGREPEAPLPVFTFHGLARAILAENSYARGLPPRPPILSDVRQRLFLDRLFRRMCLGEAGVPSLSPERLAELSPSSLSSLQEALQGVLYMAKGKGWTPDEFYNEAMAIEERFYAALPDPAAAQAGGSAKNGTLCQTIYDALSAAFHCRGMEDCLNVRKLYFNDVKKGEHRADAGSAMAEERKITARFIEAARDFYRLYETERVAEGALDFDDLIIEAVALLGEPKIRARCRERFQYVMVDEFQDTSPMQMDLIRALCSPVPRDPGCAMRPTEVPGNLTIVGDKKQAIYGWRNARRENMDEILPCNAHTHVTALTTNHRSRPEILTLANSIRDRIEPADPDITAKKGGPARIHVPAAFDGGSVAEARRLEADYVAECIQHLLQGDDTRRYGDIAVLIRKNSHFAELRRAFRERGIPYVREGATGLLEEPTCKDALVYLSVISSPLDDLHMVRVLKRGPVNLTDRDLVTMRFAEPDAGRKPEKRNFLPIILSQDDGRLDGAAMDALGALAGRLTRMAALQGSLPVRALLERLPVEAGLWDAWGPDDRAAWPGTLGTLKAIADALEQDRAALDVREFVDAIGLYAADSRLAAPATESAMEGVRVLTVHQAKGLEFPVVFVIGLGGTPKAESGWLWDDAWGVIPAVPDGAAKAVIGRWLRPRRDERADEEARCWYVAATRPKDSLFVTHILDRNGNPVCPKEITDLPTETDALVAEGACTMNTSRPETAAPHFTAPRPEAVPGPYNASFSAIEAMERCPVGLWIDRHWNLPDAVMDGQGHAGMRTGSLVHNAIAQHYAGKDGSAALESSFTPEDNDSVRGRARELWSAFRDWNGPAPEEVERAVRWTVPTERGDVILTGYVDALVREGSALRILDFKTNRELNGESLANYALQMAIYRRALLADGVAAAPTGLLVHIRPGGCETHVLDLEEAGLDDRLQKACEEIATLLAGPGMPEPREVRECGYCGYARVCPHTADSPVPSGQDLELFDESP